MSAVSESGGFGKVSMVEIKRLARETLQNNPALLKRILDEPDYLPLNSTTHTKLVMYWELVSAALEED